jgi:membrane protein YdbS with pleckstrin-like domain
MLKKNYISYISLAIVFAILLFVIAIPSTEIFRKAPHKLSTGILLDLLVTLPLIYFLVARKLNIPVFTTLYIFLIGLIAANFIIPEEHQELLSKVQYISIPLIEIGIVGMILFKLNSLRSSLKQIEGNDFYDKLLIACTETFPNRIGRIVATEIAVIYFLLSKSKNKIKHDSQFTYYKKSGIKTIVGGLLFLILIETVVVHYLLSKWNITVAWVASFLSLYACVQIIAILKSMNSRPIYIDYKNEELKLRYGFGSQTKIPFSMIENIEDYKDKLKDNKDHVHLSVFDLVDSNNISIHLYDKHTLKKIYGLDKRYNSISLYVDKKERFMSEIKNIINKQKEGSLQ